MLTKSVSYQVKGHGGELSNQSNHRDLRFLLFFFCFSEISPECFSGWGAFRPSFRLRWGSTPPSLVVVFGRVHASGVQSPYSTPAVSGVPSLFSWRGFLGESFLIFVFKPHGMMFGIELLASNIFRWSRIVKNLFAHGSRAQTHNVCSHNWGAQNNLMCHHLHHSS